VGNRGRGVLGGGKVVGGVLSKSVSRGICNQQFSLLLVGIIFS
jgi:hypothetical protein